MRCSPKPWPLFLRVTCRVSVDLTALSGRRVRRTSSVAAGGREGEREGEREGGSERARERGREGGREGERERERTWAELAQQGKPEQSYRQISYHNQENLKWGVFFVRSLLSPLVLSTGMS